MGTSRTVSRRSVITVAVAAALTLIAAALALPTAAAPSTSGVIPGVAPVEWEFLTGEAFQTAALTNDGRYFHWGTGHYSDREPTIGSAIPKEYGVGHVWVDAAVGDDSAFGVTADGGLYSMGAWLRLGSGATEGVVKDLEPIGLGHRWVAVESGSEFAAALTDDGRLFAWGQNYFGQLGQGATSGIELTPLEVIVPGVRWTSFAIGSGFTVALSDDGRLYSWGYNSSGRLGRGTTTLFEATPAAITSPDGTPWATVWSGPDASGAFGQTARNLYGWGQGQVLGVGSVADFNAPTLIPGAPSIRHLVMSQGTTMVVDSTNELWGTGDSSTGMLGPPAGFVSSFRRVSTGPWITASVGSTFYIAMATDRYLFGAGLDWYNTLGTGSDRPWEFPQLPIITPDPVPVARVPQSVIHDPALLDSRQVGSSVDLASVMMASTGMTLDVTADGTCTVVGSTVTFAAAGTCTLTVGQPGTSVYLPTSEVLAITVEAVPPTTICPLDTTTTIPPTTTTEAGVVPEVSDTPDVTPTTGVPPCFRTAPKTLAFAG